MQSRKNSFRRNEATNELTLASNGEAFTRYEAYLSLLALVGGLMINLLPNTHAIDDFIPNNSFGDICLVFYVIAWWIQVLSVLDALASTLYAARNRVYPDILGPSYEFIFGVWLTYLFYTMVFIYGAIYPGSNNYIGRSKNSPVIYAVFSFVFGVAVVPSLFIVRRIQYIMYARRGINTIIVVK